MTLILIVGVGALVALAFIGRSARWFRVRRGIGSFGWATSTRGRLHPSERLVLLVPLGAALASYIFDRAVRALRRRPDPLPGWTPPAPPTSALAQEVDQHWANLLAAAAPHATTQAALRCLHQHSLRTWVLALALAEHDRHHLDPDAVYLAALGHDLGLARLLDRADPVAGTQRLSDHDCFTLNGARAVEHIGHGVTLIEPSRVRAAMEAVVHHITPGLTLAVDDALAVYIQQGSGCDLTRQWARRIPDVDLAALFATYPRQGTSDSGEVCEIGELGATLWELESENVPAGRARLLNTAGCFVRVLRSSPYRDVG